MTDAAKFIRDSKYALATLYQRLNANMGPAVIIEKIKEFHECHEGKEAEELEEFYKEFVTKMFSRRGLTDEEIILTTRTYMKSYGRDERITKKYESLRESRSQR